MATRNSGKKPVEVGTLSDYLEGFSTIPSGWPWEFYHQQYFSTDKEHIDNLL